MHLSFFFLSDPPDQPIRLSHAPLHLSRGGCGFSIAGGSSYPAVFCISIAEVLARWWSLFRPGVYFLPLILYPHCCVFSASERRSGLIIWACRSLIDQKIETNSLSSAFTLNMSRVFSLAVTVDRYHANHAKGLARGWRTRLQHPTSTTHGSCPAFSLSSNLSIFRHFALLLASSSRPTQGLIPVFAHPCPVYSSIHLPSIPRPAVARISTVNSRYLIPPSACERRRYAHRIRDASQIRPPKGEKC